MNENPYQTPESEIEIKTVDDNVQYYIVSIKKFTILFFATVGIYSIYWFYKNWKQYKVYNSANIWPVPRGIFSIFFAHSLFREVNNTLTEKDKQFDWNPSMLATAYVVLSIFSHLFDRMSMKEIGSPYTDILSILILPLIYSVLTKAQKAINLSQNDAEGNSNTMLTAANFIWIVLGVIFWALFLIGMLVIFGFIDG